MQVGHSFKEMHDDSLGVGLCREAKLLQITVEREWIQLQDDVGRIICLINSFKIADAVMAALSKHLELFAEGSLAIAIVLSEVDRAFERFDGDLLPSGEVEGVVHAGSHALSYLFDGLEGSVEAQLHDVLATQNSAEFLKLLAIFRQHAEIDALF